MDRDLLKSYLEKNLSLGQIGALENRDRSTIRYWLNRHGLAANGRAKHGARGGLKREQLKPLVDEGLTIQVMGQRLDRSASTVRRWLRRHELSQPCWRKAQALAVRDQGGNRFEARCRRHGLTGFVALPDGRSRCARCSAAAVASYRRRIKRILIAEAGGACELCGYHRFPGALHFHHRDASTKRFGVAENGATRSLARAREEAAKCALLCANCHAEVEGGLRELAVK